MTVNQIVILGYLLILIIFGALVWIPALIFNDRLSNEFIVLFKKKNWKKYSKRQWKSGLYVIGIVFLINSTYAIILLVKFLF